MQIVRKLHQCPFCAYSTVYQNNLTKHVRTHTGEKPFVCTLCRFRTSQNSSLKRHMINIHGHSEGEHISFILVSMLQIIICINTLRFMTSVYCTHLNMYFHQLEQPFVIQGLYCIYRFWMSCKQDMKDCNNSESLEKVSCLVPCVQSIIWAWECSCIIGYTHHQFHLGFFPPPKKAE